MKKNKLIILLSLFIYSVSAQELVKSYSFIDGFGILPRNPIERKSDIVIPYTITKNKDKKAGVLFLNKDNSIKAAYLFKGKNNYVINEIIVAQNENLLLSAEGYSEEGQESLYFIELDESKIINEFIYNENGNELDPFAILENNIDNIIIGGFVKSRELVSSSFYNMYSEKQMIYVAEFSKDGKKKWSKGINLVGFENGICNQMIKNSESIFMLCHANKIGGKMTPFIIKLDLNGDIEEIIQIDKENTNLIGSKIINKDKNIQFIGSYSNEHGFLINCLFDNNLELIKKFKYELPGRILINNFSDNYILGGLIKENSYDNFAINLSKDLCKLIEFGSEKTDMLVGVNNDFFLGYRIGDQDFNSKIMTFKNSQIFTIHDKKSLELIINNNIDFRIESKFISSTINKGVEKVEIVDVTDKFLVYE